MNPALILVEVAMDKVYWVYITTSDRTEALELAERIVQNRLAACVNVLSAIESVYRWKGKLEKDREVAMVAKTTAGMLQHLTEFVRQHHSYECPCLVALPVEGGNQDFLQWVHDQVAEKTG